MPRQADHSCTGTKKDGSPCPNRPRPGKRYCMFHDPALADARAEGRKKGGVNRSQPAATLPPDTPPLALGSVADVTRALAEAYNLVRVGKLAVNVGNCLAVLGQALLKSMEKGDLEQRIEALETARQRRAR
jgi:hypothetical protein